MPYIPYLPYIPNIPYFPNMPYQTDHTHHTYPPYHTTPPPHHRGGRGTVPHPHHTTGGGGGRSHMGPVYGTHPPHHRGGGGQCHTPTTPQGGEGEDLIWDQYMGPIHHTTGGEGDSATPPPHHRGGGGRSHMGPVYGTHPIWGGEGGWQGLVHIYIYNLSGVIIPIVVTVKGHTCEDMELYPRREHLRYCGRRHPAPHQLVMIGISPLGFLWNTGL